MEISFEEQKKTNIDLAFEESIETEKKYREKKNTSFEWRLLGDSSVDREGVVSEDGTDGALSSEAADDSASEGGVDLVAVSDDGGGDHLHLGDVDDGLVVGGLVEEDGVVELAGGTLLGPLLSLCTCHGDKS